ncbi:MAG: FMN-binding protein [Spirochaetes bacterium]|jgi:hypothetical protein|nr:FMN-binding protein [Spirochaetota bacterium]
MKHLGVLLLLLVSVLAFTACESAGDDPEAGADGGAGAEAASESQEVSGDAIPVENAFMYRHVDGHQEERQFPAFVMFEYEQLETVKYQVGFIACTCRGPEVNYWSVAYVEINKADNTIANYSMDDDTGGKYTAGLYGDSVKSWDGTPVQELFYEEFIPEYIMGASEEEIDAYETMHGEVDTFTGATVTPNNNMQMLKGLMDYHRENYS